ncbi:MAG: GNAT family N-acetyltransferase [Ruminococcus sp.]|nr:GNAT family N-acetyltransferase [Ruminococcus sp.]
MLIVHSTNFNEAYDILESSFIPAELKPRDVLLSQWKNGEVNIAVQETDGEISGVITLWEFPEFVFAENFAVKEDFRNKGIGAALLRDVISKYSDKRIILEVEPPESDLQKRRIMFYERNGFTLSPFGYIQPALRAGCDDVKLQIMHTGDNLCDKEFNNIKTEVFTTVYKCIAE